MLFSSSFYFVVDKNNAFVESEKTWKLDYKQKSLQKCQFPSIFLVEGT